MGTMPSTPPGRAPQGHGLHRAAGPGAALPPFPSPFFLSSAKMEGRPRAAELCPLPAPRCGRPLRSPHPPRPQPPPGPAPHPPGFAATAPTAPEHRGRIPRPHPHRAAALGHHHPPPPPSAEPHPAPPPSPGPHPAPGPLPAAVPGAARRSGSRPARSLSMARGGAGGRAVPSCAAPRRPGSPRPAGEESRSSPPRPRACRHRWGGMGWSRDAPPDITAPGTAAGVEADPQPRVRPPPSFLVFSQMPVLTTTLTSPSITWSRSPARMNLKAEPALPAQPPPSGSAAPSLPAQRDADFQPRAPSPPFVGLTPISLPPEAPSTASSCSAPQGDVDAPLHRATLHPTLTPTTGATHGAAAPLGAGRCSDAQFRFLQASPCQRCLFWE